MKAELEINKFWNTIFTAIQEILQAMLVLLLFRQGCLESAIVITNTEFWNPSIFSI